MKYQQIGNNHRNYYDHGCVTYNVHDHSVKYPDGLDELDKTFDTEQEALLYIKEMYHSKRWQDAMCRVLGIKSRKYLPMMGG